MSLDLSAAEYTPETDNVDRGEVKTWNVAVERRLMFDTSVGVAYVGAKGSGGYAAPDINAPRTLGVGDAGRPYAAQGRLLAINSWGQRLKTDYESLQIALNKPFTHGLLLKGAYTLSKSMNQTDNDGRATLTWNTPSELWRNWAPAGFDRRHNFQLGFAYALPRYCGSRSARVPLRSCVLGAIYSAFSARDTPWLPSSHRQTMGTSSANFLMFLRSNWLS
ncbi:MAG TPA: hypothetical protein VFT39_03005 [Vicinamibacterales bacterium]|nr:hypothetical protein [Vicinamibacterales bacterium]